MKSFATFVYDFIVGDDWRLAVGSLGAIAGVALLDATGVNGWWLAVAAAPATLWWSLRASRARAATPGPPRDGRT